MSDETYEVDASLAEEKFKEDVKQLLLQIEDSNTSYENEKDSVAKLQQEYGMKALPIIKDALESGSLGSYRAAKIVEGMPGDEEMIYDFAKYMAKKYILKEDGSAFIKAVETMMATGSEGKIIEDLEQMKETLESEDARERLSDGHHSRISAVEYYINRDLEDYRESRSQKINESIDIYINGYSVWFQRRMADNEEQYDEDDYDSDGFTYRTYTDTKRKSPLVSYEKMFRYRLVNDPDVENKLKIRLERRRLNEREQKPSKYLPTIGTEIEVPEHGVPESVKEKALMKYGSKQKSNLTKVYEETKTEFDVPSGADATYEFAFSPSNFHETQSRLVHELYQHGYLNPEHKKYAMHVSIGGVKDEKNARILMFGLYASGWSTSSRRLSMSGIDIKGNDSLHMKKPDTSSDIDLPEGSDSRNKESVSEMRGFTLRGLREYQNTIKTAYLLGAAAKAFEVEESKRDDIEKLLAEVWMEYNEGMIHILEANGVDYLPSTDWSRPMHSLKGLVGALKHSEETGSPKSIAPQTRAFLRKIREKIAKILDNA